MIDPSVFLSLQTKNEMRVAFLLSTSAEPMRHKDIAEALKLNKQRCTEALRTLVENQVVNQDQKLGVTIYERIRCLTLMMSPL